MKKLLALILILNLIPLVAKVKRNLPVLTENLRGETRSGNPRSILDVFEMFDWLNAQKAQGLLDSNTVIAYRRPHWCYYYTGFKSVSFPFTKKVDKVFDAIYKADLVIVENYDFASQNFLNPAIRDSSDYFVPLYIAKGEVPNVAVFRIKKGLKK